jgi:hypothetical protein
MASAQLDNLALAYQEQPSVSHCQHAHDHPVHLAVRYQSHPTQELAQAMQALQEQVQSVDAQAHQVQAMLTAEQVQANVELQEVQATVALVEDHQLHVALQSPSD